jgi:ribose transport system substrate-binding protein
MKKLLVIVIIVMLVVSLTACGQEAPAEAPVEEAPAKEEPAPAEEAAPEEPAVHSNADDFTYVEDEGSTFDINGYYSPLGVECDVTIKSTGGRVNVPDVMTSPLPKAAEAYTIGFSVYYTVDEVGSMILETMKSSAKEAGVELLVNDANYDQSAQNQAIEQWILEGVDGVILAPCDFTGVKGALDALGEANIPVVTLNPPLAGTVDSVVMLECVEEGLMAGQVLVDAIKASGVEMKGSVIFQTLPFVHPNAATRSLGFHQAFEDYPDIELVELTGISPEDHYTAFEGAIQAYPDMLGAWGLYSSATIGMNNAKKAAGRDDILLSSVDNDKPILKGIYDGEILGSACYSSMSPAAWCMSQMVNLLNGVEVPSAVHPPNMLVTKDNVEEAFELYYPGKTLQQYIDGEIE